MRLFGQMIGRPFNEGSEGADDGRDEANDESYFQADGDSVFPIAAPPSC